MNKKYIDQILDSWFIITIQKVKNNPEYYYFKISKDEKWYWEKTYWIQVRDLDLALEKSIVTINSLK